MKSMRPLVYTALATLAFGLAATTADAGRRTGGSRGGHPRASTPSRGGHVRTPRSPRPPRARPAPVRRGGTVVVRDREHRPVRGNGVHVHHHHRGYWLGPAWYGYGYGYGYHDGPYYGGGYYAAPSTVAVASTGPRVRRFGLGAALGWTDAESAADRGTHGALLARYRGERLELEGELGGTQDTSRLGAALYVNFGEPWATRPYVLIGTGIEARRDPVTQDESGASYLSAGVGLAVPVGSSVSLTGDVRALSWRGAGDAPERERAAELRLGAMIYF